MQGKYRKFMITMERVSEGWKFWENDTAAPVCYVESYKEKRAVFFHGRNLLPGNHYHIILIGDQDGMVEHQELGPLQTSGTGELRCYRTFTGPALDIYDYCLLCGEKEDGQMDIVYKGALFSASGNLWDDLCGRAVPIEPFSPGCDETEAKWYRCDVLESLPVWIQSCQSWMESYGHYIIGRNEDRYFLGIPGRFLQKEQPLREVGVFLLWQPMKGGESFFDRPDQMSQTQQEQIFGYWIAGMDIEMGILHAL